MPTTIDIIVTCISFTPVTGASTVQILGILVSSLVYNLQDYSQCHACTSISGRSVQLE